MIKSLKVTGLNQGLSFDLNFHEDINIITGRNGSGKTTVLKLLWYAISGNIERIFEEIKFESFEVVTDKVRVGVSVDRERVDPQVCLGYQVAGGQERDFRWRAGQTAPLVR